MSYKISMILSMVFVSLFFLLGIDFINLQCAYTELDQKAIAISYEISKTGTTKPSFIKTLEQKYDVTFICNSNCSPKVGDVVTFTLIDTFKPYVISQEVIEITIQRTSIIGFYS